METIEGYRLMDEIKPKGLIEWSVAGIGYIWGVLEAIWDLMKGD